LAAVAAKGPQPCSTAKVAAIVDHTYTADQLAAHYGLTPLYAAGDLGQGIHVGLPDLDPFQTADIKAFDACYHITTKYTVTTVVSGVGTGPGAGESTNDLENISSLAPAATIDLYQAPSTLGDLYTVLKVIANENRDRVVAIPYGVCEHDLPQSDITAFQTQVDAGASFGQTWIAASGDTGTAGCYRDGTPANAAVLSVETPASASFLLAVGGTSVSAAVPLSAESAWNSSAAGKQGGASGGGLSSQCMPVYQATNQVDTSAPPVIPNLFTQAKKVSGCLSKSDPKGYVRQVPDISADADYHTGYTFYWDKTWNFEWGGTSNSATLVAAETALIDSSPLCGKNGWQSSQFAMFPSFVYAIANHFETSVYQSSPPDALYDPTKGNNDYTPSGVKNGRYLAVKGYDLATGLGVPLLTGVGYVNEIGNPGMAAYMCLAMKAKNFPSVSTTSVSPSSIPAGKTVTVTVHGSGMLLLKNTDWAAVFYRGSDFKFHTLYLHTVACSTRSSCQLTIPGAYTKKAQTVFVELEPEFIGCNGNACKQPTAPLKIVKK
jgi:subtilase family serine protease